MSVKDAIVREWALNVGGTRINSGTTDAKMDRLVSDCLGDMRGWGVIVSPRYIKRVLCAMVEECAERERGPLPLGQRRD